jgi:hypothetical protein
MAQHQARPFYLSVLSELIISRCGQENPRLWCTAQADGSLSVWMCNDNAGRPVVLYSNRIGSDCSQGTCVFLPPRHALTHNRVAGSPLDKSFLVRFSAADDHVVLLAGASMGGNVLRMSQWLPMVLLSSSVLPASIMWFDWKKNAVCQVLSLEHVRTPKLSATPLLNFSQVAVSMDACPTGNLIAIGTRDRVIKLIDFQHATLQVSQPHRRRVTRRYLIV